MFLLIWGTRRIVRRAGYVAEICPLCREVRVVKISRVAMVGHLFFVSLGRGTLLGFIGECQQCSATFELLGTDYLTFVKDKRTDLASLIEQTNPRRAPGNVAAEEAFRRYELLIEPFLRFDQSLALRYAQGSKWELGSGLAIAAAFLLPIAIVVVAALNNGFAGSVGVIVGWSAAIIFFTGLVACIAMMNTEPKRYFAKKLAPALVAEVSALRPTTDEISRLIDRLQACGYQIGTLVTPPMFATPG